jgi:uncharacterized SAM-binding protein YcdF (DUF218 family)
MDTLLSLKPILSSLVMPAAGGLLALFALLIWAWHCSTPQTKHQVRLPIALAGLCVSALWLLSCQGFAIWLSVYLLPQVTAVTPKDLLTQQVQAIVVLGGGLESEASEYSGAALSPESLNRLMYGAYLSQQTQRPMLFTGGSGWASRNSVITEADVADQTLTRLNLQPLHWKEGASRDTHENARLSAQLLAKTDVQQIALVTHAWHMPRAVKQFTQAGLRVTPAPMGFIRSDATPLLQWIPSGKGLRDCGWVIHEWLGLMLT